MKLILLTSIIFRVCLHVQCLLPFDYCTIECDDGPGKHTMCMYPEDDGGPFCEHFKTGLMETDKNTILDMHNKNRQKVALGNQPDQPPASNMMEMEWDEELAMIAQWWSIQCTKYLSHDTCRNTRDGERAGQNVALIKEGKQINSSNKIERMVQSWYDEVDDLAVIDLKTFNPSKFMSVGHYTQMIWGPTTKIGCGYSYDNKSNGVFVLVCNYKPAGNIMNMPMYRIGDACSKCPNGTYCSKLYPGICNRFNLTEISSGTNLQFLTGLYISYILFILENIVV